MRRISIYIRWRVAVLATLLISPFINAAENSVSFNNDDSQGFSSTVSMEYLYDDNILRSQNQIIDASILIVSPQLSFVTQKDKQRYEFIIDGEIGKYDGSSEDNYTDKGLSFSGDFDLNSRNRFNVLASVDYGHDERGAGFSRGFGELLTEVDEFRSHDLGLNYSYGHQATAGQLNFSLLSNTVDYYTRLDSNNVDRTSVRDRDGLTAGVEFVYNLTAKMDMLATYRRADIEYDFNTGLDSTEDALLVGLSWQGTAKTTGTIRLGYRSRSLDNSASDDESATWDIGIVWSPLSYSRVNFTTGKSTAETIGIGNFQVITTSGISWTHDWKSRLSSELGYVFTDTEFDGTNISDETTSYRASLTYQMKDWLDINLSYINTERTSNSSILPFNYDREIISLSFVVSMQ